MARVRDILRMFRTIFLVAGDMDLSGISFETQIGQWVVYICLCLYLCATYLCLCLCLSGFKLVSIFCSTQGKNEPDGLRKHIS
jgi:hypothetical protein